MNSALGSSFAISSEIANGYLEGEAALAPVRMRSARCRGV